MSEDDSEDRLDQIPHDPERLKAFNVSFFFYFFFSKEIEFNFNSKFSLDVCETFC